MPIMIQKLVDIHSISQKWMGNNWTTQTVKTIEPYSKKIFYLILYFSDGLYVIQ